MAWMHTKIKCNYESATIILHKILFTVVIMSTSKYIIDYINFITLPNVCIQYFLKQISCDLVSSLVVCQNNLTRIIFYEKPISDDKYVNKYVTFE